MKRLELGCCLQMEMPQNFAIEDDGTVVASTFRSPSLKLLRCEDPKSRVIGYVQSAPGGVNPRTFTTHPTKGFHPILLEPAGGLTLIVDYVVSQVIDNYDLDKDRLRTP